MRPKEVDRSGLERQHHLSGTEGSNPASSSGESANHRFHDCLSLRSIHACGAGCPDIELFPADERCRTDKLDGVIKHRSSRETTMVGRGASLDVRLFLGGTDGSNPVPSSAESASNRSNGVRGQMSANYRLASRPTLTTDLMVENRRKHDQTARICIVIGLSAARAARTARSPASLLRP